jgi:hypothetical protein
VLDPKRSKEVKPFFDSLRKPPLLKTTDYHEFYCPLNPHPARILGRTGKKIQIFLKKGLTFPNGVVTLVKRLKERQLTQGARTKTNQ